MRLNTVISCNKIPRSIITSH